MAFDGRGEGGFRGPKIEIPDFRRMGQNLGGLRWLIAAAIILIILGVATIYTVEPEEVVVVLRLGKYHKQQGPGIHLRVPGVDTLFRLPLQRQLKDEFGFETVSTGIRSETSTRGHAEESNMLTGDLNAAVVEWVVQYRIADAESYLFRVRNVRQTFRDMSEAVMRRVVGDRTVNEVITVGRQEIEDIVKQELQELCDEYQTGIRVDQVVLQDVNPPDPVKPSFNEVNQAEQERERLINEAQQQYNQVVPRAAGEAQKTIEEAEGYALDRVNRAQGDAARFRSVYTEYRKAPEVTRQRIYLETMSEMLPQVGRKLIVDEEVEGLLPLLNLDAVTPLSRPPAGGQP